MANFWYIKIGVSDTGR